MYWWPEHPHPKKVSGQVWRSSSFSCSLCWVLPECVGMMLRFASALDLPAAQPALDQLGKASRAEVQPQRLLNTASF